MKVKGSICYGTEGAWGSLMAGEKLSTKNAHKVQGAKDGGEQSALPCAGRPLS